MITETDGIRWNVIMDGHGAPALVFLHYFGGSARAWEAVIAKLGDAYLCMAPDLRGFGGTQRPDTEYSVEDAAGDLSALLANLALDRYMLVGHSMGGKIALELAGRRPAGLAALALVAPSPPTPEPMTEEDRQRQLEEHPGRALALETVGKITARPLPEATVERIVEDNLRSAPEAWSSWLLRGSRENLSERAAQIEVPIGIIVGDQDPVISADLLRRTLLSILPQCRLDVVPDAGHLLPYEAPDAVAALIRRILREVK